LVCFSSGSRRTGNGDFPAKSRRRADFRIFRADIVDDNLRSTFPSLPIVRLALDGGSPHSHWSDSKQGELADQFLRAVIRLSGQGVRRIHLVLAAPNSIVFRFGRSYDKRNLPSVTVYQFENGSIPAYPWGVDMPVGGTSRAAIVRAPQPSAN
jgi:hypothetical protein